MKKIIYLLLFIIIIILGAWFVVFNKTTSLQSLIEEGSPVTCTYSIANKQGNMTSGTIYVADGRVAIDDTITGITPQPTSAHSVIDSGIIYNWSSLSTTTAFMNTLTPTSTTGGITYNARINYKCHTWTPVESKFNIPDDFIWYNLDTGKRVTSRASPI